MMRVTSHSEQSVSELPVLALIQRIKRVHVLGFTMFQKLGSDSSHAEVTHQ